jgi:hypothetical protein
MHLQQSCHPCRCHSSEVEPAGRLVEVDYFQRILHHILACIPTKTRPRGQLTSGPLRRLFIFRLRCVPISLRWRGAITLRRISLLRRPPVVRLVGRLVGRLTAIRPGQGRTTTILSRRGTLLVATPSLFSRFRFPCKKVSVSYGG